jgi:hypothetical protein
MTEPDILYSKEGFVFVKNKTNNYSLSFAMENANIVLPKIIDFNLVKLIYDLNNDIYEKVDLKIMNENEAILYSLMKHLFEDLGFPQRFSYLHITKIVGENNVKFISQTIKSETPVGLPENVELMHIQSMICNCDIITQHKILFTVNILFDNTMVVPSVAEKLVGLILYKIFKRIKQFIEKVRV